MGLTARTVRTASPIIVTWLHSAAFALLGTPVGPGVTLLAGPCRWSALQGRGLLRRLLLRSRPPISEGSHCELPCASTGCGHDGHGHAAFRSSGSRGPTVCHSRPESVGGHVDFPAGGCRRGDSVGERTMRTRLNASRPKSPDRRAPGSKIRDGWTLIEDDDDRGSDERGPASECLGSLARFLTTSTRKR